MTNLNNILNPEDKILLYGAMEDIRGNEKLADELKEAYRDICMTEAEELDKIYRFNNSLPESDYTREELEQIWEKKEAYLKLANKLQ